MGKSPTGQEGIAKEKQRQEVDTAQANSHRLRERIVPKPEREWTCVLPTSKLIVMVYDDEKTQAESMAVVVILFCLGREMNV